MINQDLLKYIKDELAKGTSRDLIAKNLMSGGGWTMEEIVFHFGFTDTAPVVAVQNLEPQKLSTPTVPAPIVVTTPVSAPTPTPAPDTKPISPAPIENLTAPLATATFTAPQEDSGLSKILILTGLCALLIVGSGLGYRYYMNNQPAVVAPAPVPTPAPAPAPVESASPEDFIDIATTTPQQGQVATSTSATSTPATSSPQVSI